MRALLVEDSPQDRMIMARAFKTACPDDEMRSVSDGVEALGFLTKNGSYPDAWDPDVVLLDLNLPKKDGLEVLREIRSHKEMDDLPVIILTTSQWQADVHAAHLLKATGFWSKPSRYAEIIEMLRSLKHYARAS